MTKHSVPAGLLKWLLKNTVSHHLVSPVQPGVGL